ncbi:MAG: hypothetical protein J6Q10_03185 [Clostridia bacterium]|nr:hypothetical protein [Clostridia bacterium]
MEEALFVRSVSERWSGGIILVRNGLSPTLAKRLGCIGGFFAGARVVDGGLGYVFGVGLVIDYIGDTRILGTSLSEGFQNG